MTVTAKNVSLLAPVLALSAALAMGAGCATKTGTGAAAGGASGAAVGAGIGALAGGGKGALIGAGVGAAAGAGTGALVGRYMDRQQQALEKEVKGAHIERQGDQLAVRFDEAILFDFNKAVIKEPAKRDLDELARVLKDYNQTDLVIEGHTDNIGTRNVNERLSWQRAEAVLGYLASQGVGRERLSARGLADTRPVASNDTDLGRAQNRRVQIQIAANQALKNEDSKQKAAAGKTSTSTTPGTVVPASQR
jgi:outer membrane protein OmpA-like peptidoglycan-associated protein